MSQRIKFAISVLLKYLSSEGQVLLSFMYNYKIPKFSDCLFDPAQPGRDTERDEIKLKEVESSGLNEIYRRTSTENKMESFIGEL